jgi:hypothetical protein
MPIAQLLISKDAGKPCWTQILVLAAQKEIQVLEPSAKLAKANSTLQFAKDPRRTKSA